MEYISCFLLLPIDLLPGFCHCKTGYAGESCNRCALGYTGYPECLPCNCSLEGSENDDPCVGPCICKVQISNTSEPQIDINDAERLHSCSFIMPEYSTVLPSCVSNLYQPLLTEHLFLVLQNCTYCCIISELTAITSLEISNEGILTKPVNHLFQTPSSSTQILYFTVLWILKFDFKKRKQSELMIY